MQINRAIATDFVRCVESMSYAVSSLGTLGATSPSAGARDTSVRSANHVVWS